ncbi:odv-e27 [Cnaphalocrocis medinalis granulovirus]|uniref:Odv-e27 n=1 Tax=Cnaphalocrocis medinalis granulovirus TaxID=1750712 RepID=A0A125QVW5_9BBAC|nr:odv-e27 [Cnaphalocrocis medinalis granulovirus]ALN42018.1 odv-e27 [Cnaphalocrocis medinalis granulovirus]AMF83830.1 odv-e27 [Cnaphalocrocis medinalis granulovirus]
MDYSLRDNNDEPVENYRTVTEIVDANNAYQKDFDLTELEFKNEIFLRQTNKRKLYLMVARYYLEVVRVLNIPDMRSLFGNNTMLDKMFEFVYLSLAFVNNQVMPHCTEFMELNFVKIEERRMSVPTDPIVFYKSLHVDDNKITCYVDAANILRILEKPIDVNLKFDLDEDTNIEMFKFIDQLKVAEQKHHLQNMGCGVANRAMYADRMYNQQQVPNMDEQYVTSFVTCLLLFTNAYLDLLKIKNSDFKQYYNHLLDHEGLIKERSMPNVNNIITSYFNFKINTESTKRTIKTNNLIFKRL